MNPQTALFVLSKLLGKVSGTRDEFVEYETALRALAEFVNKAKLPEPTEAEINARPNQN